MEQVERVQGWAAILNGKKGAERDLNILLGDGQMVQGGNLLTRITNIVKKMPQDKLFQLLCNLLPLLSPVHVAELMVEIHLSEDDLWIRACELMEPLCINAMVRERRAAGTRRECGPIMARAPSLTETPCSVHRRRRCLRLFPRRRGASWSSAHTTWTRRARCSCPNWPSSMR